MKINRAIGAVLLLLGVVVVPLPGQTTDVERKQFEAIKDLEGNGVPKNIPEGIKWTRRAATQGFARAQNALGLCYTKGTGVPKDYVQSPLGAGIVPAQKLAKC